MRSSEGLRRAPWLRKRLPTDATPRRTAAAIADLHLSTVCESARCPNLWECYGRRTATFLILGNRCTRKCAFCSVAKGRPEALQDDEPARVAEAARRLGVRHVVVTSVTRDDLPDGGAAHFAATIEAIRARLPGVTVEVLVPDFRGNREALRTVIGTHPEVIGHNLETVRRLLRAIRPLAHYERSLAVLAQVKAEAPDIVTKSGLMVGLGETPQEVVEALRDLRRVRCDVATIGQYLRPSEEQVEPVAFVEPEQFDWYAVQARAMGFRAVASAPFVRSSYGADRLVKALSEEGVRTR